jgi:Ubiquinol-cytochrome C reductase hinge protein
MQDSEASFTTFGNHSYTDYHGDMADSTGLIEYPYSRIHPRYPNSRKNSLQRGEDPKEKWIQYCKPSCTEQQHVLKRCEEALKIVRSVEADKTCIYRFRQYAECIENCVQPKIFYHLRGASRAGPVDWFKAHGPSGLH